MNEKDYIEERVYFPAGLDPDHIDASLFGVRVQWRGQGKWAVVQGLGFPGHRFLSSTGKWLWLPRPMHRRHCRFDFETACRLAEEHVNTVTINGGTWAQHEARRQVLPSGKALARGPVVTTWTCPSDTGPGPCQNHDQHPAPKGCVHFGSYVPDRHDTSEGDNQ